MEKNTFQPMSFVDPSHIQSVPLVSDAPEEVPTIDMKAPLKMETEAPSQDTEKGKYGENLFFLGLIFCAVIIVSVLLISFFLMRNGNQAQQIVSTAQQR